MKLFIPIFKDLPISSGFSIQNLGLLRRFKIETELICTLWNGFEILTSTRIKFDGSHHINIFLDSLFSEKQLSESGLATLEFDLKSFSIEDQIKIKKNLFEAEVTLKAKKTGSWATVLYDLIGDKKTGHQYTPILHCAHTADVNTHWDSLVLLLNFRPPYLKTDKKTQSMTLELKSNSGELLKTKLIEIPFNYTYTVSFREEFEKIGTFKPGYQMNFKGGESQFAIFTLFWNAESQSIGLEHSLPPVYYCKGIFDTISRNIFYKNAFAQAGEKL